jgi:hypothetical protein
MKYMTIEKAIQEYQCSGCVNGIYQECFTEGQFGSGCGAHCVGTIVYGGLIFCGMPKGFNRMGNQEHHLKLIIFKSWKAFIKGWGAPIGLSKEPGYSRFNVPVWKHLDEHGSTLVRGLSPRNNAPFLHVFLEDVRDKVECLEITAKDIQAMD